MLMGIITRMDLNSYVDVKKENAGSEIFTGGFTLNPKPEVRKRLGGEASGGPSENGCSP